MPNPENFTRQRPIRVPDEAWEAFGRVVGDRSRSEYIKAYIDWQIAHPHAQLDAEPEEQVLDFLVRVRLGNGSRRAEIVELPGVGGPQAEKLKAEIRQAIADYFSRPAAKAHRRRPTK